MGNMDRKDIVRQISLKMKNFVPEAETILYGSEARGEAMPDSDIDILVLLPDLDSNYKYVERRSYILGLMYELSLASGVDISPIILPKQIWNSRRTPFTINVRNEGIRI